MLWHPHWHNIDQPVVLLKRALYGHPQAGAFWEEHLETALKSEGFVKVKGWKSTYRHPVLSLLLVVYVDDFKMSGPATSVPQGWALIKKSIKIGEPSSHGRFLGCLHEEGTLTENDRSNIPSAVCPLTCGPIVGVGTAEGAHSPTARCITYNMEDFLRQCLARYEECCQSEVAYKEVQTPNLDDNLITNEDRAVKGHLESYASSILMKILYGARVARWDVLFTVCFLARHVTKWSREMDRRLYRLMCYLHCTLGAACGG